jgi:hypothetical protein
MGFTVQDVVLKGGNVFQLVIGAKKPYTNNGISVIHCLANGKLTGSPSFPNAIGFAIRGGSGEIRNCWAKQCNIGLQVANSIDVRSFHCEVCNTGALIGRDPAGNLAGWSGDFQGQFEACLTALNVKNGSGDYRVQILGEKQTVPGQSQIGLLIGRANRAEFHVGINGQFSTAAAQIRCGGRMRFKLSNADNHYSGAPAVTYAGSSGGLIGLDLCTSNGRAWPAPPP